MNLLIDENEPYIELIYNIIKNKKFESVTLSIKERDEILEDSINKLWSFNRKEFGSFLIYLGKII